MRVNGNVTARDFFCAGADCAEEFDAADSDQLEPGTVVVIDIDGAVTASRTPYDLRVAGVVSGAGDYCPGLLLDRHASVRKRVPIALVGKVYCKVDAHYSSIQVGDLLTTSPTPGHAMKAEDRIAAFGAVLGKALGPLAEGCGLIPILAVLQ